MKRIYRWFSKLVNPLYGHEVGTFPVLKWDGKQWNQIGSIRVEEHHTK